MRRISPSFLVLLSLKGRDGGLGHQLAELGCKGLGQLLLVDKAQLGENLSQLELREFLFLDPFGQLIFRDELLIQQYLPELLASGSHPFSFADLPGGPGTSFPFLLHENFPLPFRYKGFQSNPVHLLDWNLLE